MGFSCSVCSTWGVLREFLDAKKNEKKRENGVWTFKKNGGGPEGPPPEHTPEQELRGFYHLGRKGEGDAIFQCIRRREPEKDRE